MTDKQIIINGFNLEYIKELLYNGQRSAISTNIFEAIIEELERKEQECKNLREDIKDIARLLDLDTSEEYNFGNIELEIKQLKAKEQECEELKKERNEYFELMAIRTEVLAKIANKLGINTAIIENKEIFNKIDQLKAENEELKKQLMQKSEIDMFFNTPLEGWSSNPCDICRYKQTLTEIKEIANKTLWKYSNLDDVTKYNMFDKILQKISEVEND